MPRRKPIFSQRQGMPSAMPASARARMQSNSGQMARQARMQARNPMAGRIEARQNARDARRQMPFSGELSSMRKRASTRPIGLKAEWQQSFWFQIPIVGGLVDLLRNLVYPQEHFRTMKRAFVGTGIGSIAKNRAMARLEQQRQEKPASRQQALVQRNRAPVPRNTIAGRRARGTQNYPRKKTA